MPNHHAAHVPGTLTLSPNYTYLPFVETYGHADKKTLTILNALKTHFVLELP